MCILNYFGLLLPFYMVINITVFTINASMQDSNDNLFLHLRKSSSLSLKVNELRYTCIKPEFGKH